MVLFIVWYLREISKSGWVDDKIVEKSPLVLANEVSSCPSNSLFLVEERLLGCREREVLLTYNFSWETQISKVSII